MAKRRVGIWLIGAFGGVGSSVALGLAALQQKLIDTTGLVTALPCFANVDLDSLDDIVVGGHEIRKSNFARECAFLGGGTPAYPPNLIGACLEQLDEWTKNVSLFTTFRRMPSHLIEFVEANGLNQLVVVNVASTEPPIESQPLHSDRSCIEKMANAGDESALPASCWYAFTAINNKCPYVNFTPSPGVNLPALLALAKDRGVPVAGSDGKTGETLVKSALAPMFAARNLKVLSWVGHNILGNRDGQSLSDTSVRASKLRSKDRAVTALLGEQTQALTTIECVESLDDWKTAWDHIHFQGFLGVRMNLQFTWHGCDSALAAPLVIDLARLMLLAQRRGESGPLLHLAAFFKSPLGTDEHDLSRQMNMLTTYAQAASRQK